MTQSDNPRVNPDQPKEEQIIALLSNFKPHPRQQFHLRMRQAPWNKEKNQYSFKAFQSLRTLPRNALAVFFVFLILFLFIFTPAFVSNARQILRFFRFHDENARTVEFTQTPTSQSTPTLTEYQFSLSIEEASKAVDFPLKILTTIPEGTTLEGAAYNETRQAVLIKYSGEGKTFLITQREKTSVSEYASIGSSAPAVLVTVRGVPGEFITGGWVVQSVPSTPASPGGQTIQLVWENQTGMWTLRWEENGIVYEIVAASSQSISLDEILAITKSMR